MADRYKVSTATLRSALAVLQEKASSKDPRQGQLRPPPAAQGHVRRWMGPAGSSDCRRRGPARDSPHNDTARAGAP
ncbi:hypothetical protein LV779_38260 [Streptomyces thinghirensis]|nr:hypothetical protein [Streptomyces thinghirensis]